MVEKKPSTRSPKRSSAEPSKAGDGRARPAAGSDAARGAKAGSWRGAGWVEAETLLDRLDSSEFPACLYLEGPDESLKAALLAEIRSAWARACPESPTARVFRAAESGVEEILAAFQGGSLFSPRELIIVLDIEDLGRSEKKVVALAEGLRRPGASTLVLVESAADSPRKSLEPLRSATAARWLAAPPGRNGLIRWGTRRLKRLSVEVEKGVVELIADASEGDASAFFNEMDKLASWARPGESVSLADAQTVLRPVPGADLPAYLSAVAMGDPKLAAQRLGRLLAAGVSEGTVLFALVNLVGGAMGGWARHRDLSAALGGRRSPRELTRALDALYRAESAWKRGRADVVAVLEQATRAVATPAH